MTFTAKFDVLEQDSTIVRWICHGIDGTKHAFRGVLQALEDARMKPYLI